MIQNLKIGKQYTILRLGNVIGSPEKYTMAHNNLFALDIANNLVKNKSFIKTNKINLHQLAFLILLN